MPIPRLTAARLAGGAWRGRTSFVLLLAVAVPGPLLPPPVRAPLPAVMSFGTGLGDHATGVVARGGFIYVAGHSQGSLDGPNLGDADVIIRKYHPEGDLLWARQFGSGASDRAAAVAADAEGNAYVVGVTSGSISGSRGGEDAFIRRYSAAGTAGWTRQFGTGQNDGAQAVAVDGAGNVIVAGYTSGALAAPALGAGDSFVRKYSSSGTLLWTRQFGTSAAESATGVAADTAGNIYVAGCTAGTLQGGAQGLQDAFLRKYGPSGDILWTRQFGTAGNDLASAIAVDLAQNVVVVGWTMGLMQGSYSGDRDAYFRRYSPSGTVLRTRQLGTAARDEANAVAIGSDGAVYVSGSTWGGLGYPRGAGDVFVVKYSAADAVLFTQQIGTFTQDLGAGIAAGQNNDLYVAGETDGSMGYNNQGGSDGFVLRMNLSGAIAWTDQ